MKYAVPLRNPKTGEQRTVVVELEPDQEADTRHHGSVGVFGHLARTYAVKNAMKQAGGYFFLDADVELVN
jgi:hypothetical protein